MKCLNCGSPHISERHPGRDALGQAGALLGAATGTARAMLGAQAGAALGAAVGTARALRGLQMGASLGSAAGPMGSVIGGVSGAVLSGVVMGSMASGVGSLLGHLADRELLDNRACDSCGHTFRASDPGAHEEPLAQRPDLKDVSKDEELTGAGAGELFTMVRAQQHGGTH
jgi:hypothetical protein